MANHYILDGGTGDGSAWNNALDDLPSTFVRGDTYYVGDGAYGSHTFSTTPSGSLYIYIKKATVADHGTATGWDNAYGDGVATFSTTSGDVWTVSSNYWDFDGQVGSGETGHGIKLTSTDTTSAMKLIRVSGAHSYIAARHIEFACPGEDHEGVNQDGFYSANAISNNLTAQYCFFHDVTRNFITWSSVTDSLIEYCVFARRHTTNNSPHGQGIQLGGGACARITIRYSVHYDQYCTAFICALDNVHDSIYVYGNIFYLNDNDRYTASNGIFTGTSGDTLNNCTFHNNIIYNIQGLNAGIDAVNGSGNYAYNNLWYDNLDVTLFRGFTHDYNAFYASGTQSETHHQDLAGDPFVNLAGRDFHLTAATDAGTSLDSPYDHDLDGVVRAIDGVWDRGALEYDSGAAPTYTVTYNGNGNTGGSVPTDPSSPYEVSATVTVLGNTGSLAKTGSVFSSWNTSADGSGTTREASDTFAMPAGNVVLYAQWVLADKFMMVLK